MKTSSRASLASLTMLVIVATAVAFGIWRYADDDSGLSPVVGHGLDALPAATATDWVTYADHLVVATVTSGKELPPSAREREVGEGLINREVTFKTEQVLWSRPGGPAAPKIWLHTAAGWRFKGDKRGEYSVEGFPRLDVGTTYVFPIAFFDDPEIGKHGWGYLGSGSIFKYANGINSSALDDVNEYPAGGVASTVLNKPTPALVTLLTQAMPDPRALAYMQLTPTQRYQKALGQN